MAKAKAKRGAKASAKKTRTTAAKPSETMQVISERDFKALLRAVKGNQSEMDELRGAIGNAIATHVEKKHLDKKAFALFRQLDRMSDRKLATTLAHFDHYREIGGLDERATRQADMIGREQELAEVDPATVNGQGAEPEAEPKASNLLAAAAEFDKQRAPATEH